MNKVEKYHKIEFLGKANKDSHLKLDRSFFNDDSKRVLFDARVDSKTNKIREKALSFELAGPRTKLYFGSSETNIGIVTCGGLCPGLNDVIRAIVYQSQAYKVKKIYGFRYGYRGIIKENNIQPIMLNKNIVNDIHEDGGTILGSSRGAQDPKKTVDYLLELKISILFTIGGDGTLRGAAEIAKEIKRRNAKISVIGIPKTIDNDISFSDKTFGFETAVEEARKVLQSAHVESKGFENGVGLVKLMGRNSGFIAAQSTLASTDVNFCFIPEVKFELEGKNGLLEKLEKRLETRNHAVIVVAEGAGQEFFDGNHEKDKSGNILYNDIGVFLEDKIVKHFKSKNISVSVKYIDPSYIIRSKPANANDSLFCLQLGQNAVHAGFSGRTNMFIGYVNYKLVHIPIPLGISKGKRINPLGRLWKTVVSITEYYK